MTRAVTRSIAALGAATLVFSGAASMIASHASADTTPPWEIGSAKDINEVGTLALYTSTGTQVTSGSVLDSPIAAYMVGSTKDTAHPKATAYLYTPKFSSPAGAWPGEQISLSTPYPVSGSGVPTVVSSAKGPVVTGSSSDESIATYIGDFPNTDTTDAGYVDAYQLRVKTSSDGTYQSLDLVVSGLTMTDGVVTGGTWTETYPGASTAPKATATTLAVSPTSTTAGKPVTLTATESAGSAHAPGTVQFSENGTKVGAAVAVSSAGLAKLTTSALPVGSDVIKASFTPTDPASYAPSVSATKTVTIIEATLANTKKPTLSGHHKVGKTEKVHHGTWSPAPTKYTYQWYLGAKKIKGATKSSFKPVKKDGGKKIKCKVTAKKSGFKSASAFTASVKVKKK